MSSGAQRTREERAKLEAYRRWIREAGGPVPDRKEFEGVAAELVRLGYWEQLDRPGRDPAYRLTPKGRLAAMRAVGEIREGYA